MVSVSLGASGKLDKSGGTLTGPLILSRDPVDALEAATRQWVLANGGGISPGLLTAKGDLIAATAPGTVTRLGVGSDGQALAADSTQATGLRWTTLPTSLPPSGSAGGDLAGSYPNPTLTASANVESIIRANRLDQFTAPTAAVSLSSQKITNLANGSASSDAAAFGQIPVVGTTAGTVAAGDDARITGSAQKSANLSDLANATTARGNLGLGGWAQQNPGKPSGVLAEVISPYACAVSGGNPLTAGVLILNLIRPDGPILVANLGIWLTTAGITANGANGLALYTEAGVLIDQTGDLSTAFASAGYIEAPLGLGTQQLAANTSYYLGVLTHFSGTTPKAASAVAGQAIPVVKGHYLSLTKSSTATFPASFTPSALTTSTAAYYMAMS